MTNCQLSIITVSYNNYAGLVKTYESIDKQQNRIFEWIVIDGGSKDETVSFLRSLHPRFPYRFVSEKDKGIYDAMNKGILLTASPFMMFLNAGDYFEGQVIPEAVDTASFVRYKTKSFLGAEISNRISDKKYGMPVPHQAIIFPADKNVLYNDQLKLAADYQLYLAHNNNIQERFVSAGGYVFYERGGLSDQWFMTGNRERWNLIYKTFGLVSLLKAIAIDVLKMPFKWLKNLKK